VPGNNSKQIVTTLPTLLERRSNMISEIPMNKEDVLCMIEAGVWDCLEQTEDCDECTFKAVCPFEEVDKDGRGSGV
jgi:hypothetical protein